MYRSIFQTSLEIDSSGYIQSVVLIAEMLKRGGRENDIYQQARAKARLLSPFKKMIRFANALTSFGYDL
ncbi:MAG: hypothetical protein ACLFR2_12055 [Candidatus Kapaibacterium sp.]